MSRAQDIITGIVVIALAVASFCYTVTFPSPRQEIIEMGPALFPRLVTAALLLLSLIIIGRAFLKKPVEQLSAPEKKTTLPFYVFIMIAGYIALINYAGFLISTTAFILLLGFLLKIGIKKSVIFTISLTLLTFFVFRILLKVPLPAGKLFGGL